ncbi:MAG: hypothetical protein HY649_05030 [Acidobacteria bacterium]|nr:hypothetical protein [Acidobacteriota bacterium]
MRLSGWQRWGVSSLCLFIAIGVAAPSAAFAQAPPLPTVLDSNFEAVEFFTVSPVSSTNFGGGTIVAAAPGTGAFGSDVFVADPGAFSDTLDGRVWRLRDLNGDGDALDAGESTLAINNTLRSPLSMDFGFGGDLFIMDYPQSSSLRFIYKLTNSATPVLSQHTTNGIFNPNTIQFLPLDGGGELLITNASQNFTIFGGTNDGRLFRTGSTSGQPSVEWSNGTNITEGVPAGWWDPNFQSGVFPGNWLLVRNGAFKDSSGTIHGSGSLWAVKDVNNDGDANDPGEARVMIPDPNVPIGAIRFDSNGVGYGFGGVNVWRFEDLNNDGDFWDFGAGAFDAGENELFITGTISFQSIDLGPNGEIYLTAASGTSPNFTSHTYLVRPTFQTTPPPPAVSGCPISGSTGEQGVFDSTNRNGSQGVAWPANAAFAFTDMGTGLVTFFDSTGTQIPSATGFPNPAPLPGFSGSEDGLHFTSIRLESGKEAAFLTNSSGRTPPVILRSCQDVILDTGSSLSWGFDPDAMNALPAGFLGGSATPAVSAGFGPRSGSLPAQGFLYPAIGGGGGTGGGDFDGGRGGPAFVIVASQRITLNGTIFANGLDAEQGASGTQQGGGGGSVRLGAVLIEGSGTINTAGGTGPGGNGPAGPIAIQAFLQDLFTGSTSTDPIRSNAVVAPVPDNLPEIVIDAVGVVALEFSDFGFPNTGSLSGPDVTLPATGSSVDVDVEVFTTGIPLGTSLRYRAVGTDGSVVTALGSVGSCECSPGEGIATGDMTLNPGVTYQIVVYPETPFALARGDRGPVPLAEPVLYATSREDRETEIQQAAMISEEEISSPLEKWARAFGAEPQAHKKLAQLHLSNQETPQ